MTTVVYLRHLSVAGISRLFYRGQSSRDRVIRDDLVGMRACRMFFLGCVALFMGCGASGNKTAKHRPQAEPAVVVPDPSQLTQSRSISAQQPASVECKVPSSAQPSVQSLPLVSVLPPNSPSMIDKQVVDCWASVETTRDSMGCHNQAFTQSEAKMHAAYRAIVVKRQGDTRFLKAFERAQRAWLLFRSAYTEAMYCAQSPALEYGSGWRGCQMADEARLNRERTAQLKAWSDGVEEGELCQGERLRQR